MAKAIHPAVLNLRRRAEAIGTPLAILNLNRFGAMYVLREYWKGCESDPAFVETVNVEVR
jgi:hypothetical protein